MENSYENSIYDIDCDGIPVDIDCDDNNPDINPAELEICDEIDNDCNGNIDEGVTITYYFDNDSDGFGDIDQKV